MVCSKYIINDDDAQWERRATAETAVVFPSAKGNTTLARTEKMRERRGDEKLYYKGYQLSWGILILIFC